RRRHQGERLPHLAVRGRELRPEPRSRAGGRGRGKSRPAARRGGEGVRRAPRGRGAERCARRCDPRARAPSGSAVQVPPQGRIRSNTSEDAIGESQAARAARAGEASAGAECMTTHRLPEWFVTGGIGGFVYDRRLRTRTDGAPRRTPPFPPPVPVEPYE